MRKRICFCLLLTAIALPVASARDIYVAAGKAGTGTQNAPYATIADAFDLGVYAGDVVHVAAGVYYGKGGSGKWVIDKTNISLVGGYSPDFSQRDPWKFQSILVRGMGPGALKEARERGHTHKWGLDLTETKASYNVKAMVVGEEDHTGAVLDGFVIDGYTRLTYRPSGDLKTDVGPIGVPLVNFSKPGCRVRNCIILNSGGPGVRLGAYGQKDDPASWSEVSNCLIINTLMQAVDFRIGNQDADKAPEGGYALIKDNTLAFVWNWLSEGYGILVGNQTNLQIENNLIAFVDGYGINNGYGNNKAKLLDNLFFNNSSGVYRFFDTKNNLTIVEDNPALFTGTDARRKFYLNSASEGNRVADPGLRPDAAFFDTFTNQVKATGGGKVVWDEVMRMRQTLGLPLVGSSGTAAQNFAPVYEHDAMLLFSPLAGAQPAADRLVVYQSRVLPAVTKEYSPIDYKNLTANLGRDVEVLVLVGQKEVSGFYVDGITKEEYVCYRSKDMQNFLYLKKGSAALEILEECRADGIPVQIRGTLHDIEANIKMKYKYGLTVDEADYGE